jgi:hypothetical protein
MLPSDAPRRIRRRLLGFLMLVWGGTLVVQSIRGVVSGFAEPRFFYKVVWIGVAILYACIASGTWTVFSRHVRRERH